MRTSRLHSLSMLNTVDINSYKLLSDKRKMLLTAGRKEVSVNLGKVKI